MTLKEIHLVFYSLWVCGTVGWLEKYIKIISIILVGFVGQDKPLWECGMASKEIHLYFQPVGLWDCGIASEKYKEYFIDEK